MDNLPFADKRNTIKAELDRVYIGGDENRRTYILAEAVQFRPGFETEPVIVNAEGEAKEES